MIEHTLAERGKRYGRFDDFSDIAQPLKEVLYGSIKWEALEPYMRESLEMIVHKIARILNGDPRYMDNWHDIAGYASLVESLLSERVAKDAMVIWPRDESRIDAIGQNGNDWAHYAAPIK